MKKINNTYAYFKATRKSPEGVYYTYLLNSDLAVRQLEEFDNGVHIENIFHICDINNIKKKISSMKFEVIDRVDTYERDPSFEQRKVKLEFKCFPVEVELSYFEEAFE